MNQEQRKAINEISLTGGFRAIQYLAEKKITELDKCSDINETNSVEAQALGKKYAVNWLKEFLRDIGILAEDKKETNKTYE